MPKGIPLTQEEQANRRREIFSAAVNLFLAKGFQETSMREVAEAAGMGKSTLYDYFQTKDDILVFVIEEETSLLTQQAQAVARLDLPPDARLKRLMELHLDFMQANKNLFLRLSAEAQRLKAKSQKRIQQKRYAYQDMLAAIIQEGIDQGCFRPVNALLAACLIINSLVSVLFTTRPTGTAKSMLNETLGIFLEGIKA